MFEFAQRSQTVANFSVSSDYPTAGSDVSSDVSSATASTSAADDRATQVAGSAAAPVVALEILRGRAKQRLRPVTVPVFLIGAADDCDLVLADDLFPDVHTYLYVTPRGVTLRQLGLQPPLYVNGEKTEVAALQNGESFRLGSSYEFRVHIDHHPPRASADRKLRFDTGEPHRIPDSNGVQHARALLAEVRAHLARESVDPATWAPSSGTLPQFLDQLQTRLNRAVA